MVVDNLLGDALISSRMLSVEHNDPINAKILAISEDKIEGFVREPFAGHVVLRSTDTVSAGSDYKLWTTLKVPRGFSLEAHCELLAKKIGAERFRLMPAKGIFTLGVGHVRRKTIEPGSKAEEPAKMIPVQIVDLTSQEWNVLLALKREFSPEEITPTPWAARANEAEIGR